MKLLKRIAIDMDKVVADTMAHYLALYNAEFQLDLTPTDLLERRIFEVIDARHVTRFRELFYQEKFFSEIPVMHSSQEIIQDLRADYELFVATAAHGSAELVCR